MGMYISYVRCVDSCYFEEPLVLSCYVVLATCSHISCAGRVAMHTVWDSYAVCDAFLVTLGVLCDAV